MKKRLLDLEKELRMLEVDAARWAVSLATYLRITLFVKRNFPYDVPEKLRAVIRKGGKAVEDAIDEFETTGYLHPELGYVIWKYLQSHPKNDILSHQFFAKMEDPPT